MIPHISPLSFYHHLQDTLLILEVEYFDLEGPTGSPVLGKRESTRLACILRSRRQ